MKTCPTCGKRYEDDDMVFCPADGRLLAAAEKKAEGSVEEASSDASGAEEDDSIDDDEPTKVAGSDYEEGIAADAESDGTPVVDFGELVREHPTIAERIGVAAGDAEASAEFEADIPTVDAGGVTLVEKTSEVEVRVAQVRAQLADERAGAGAQANAAAAAAPLGSLQRALHERPTKPARPVSRGAPAPRGDEGTEGAEDDERTEVSEERTEVSEAPPAATAIPNLTAQLRERLAALSTRKDDEGPSGGAGPARAGGSMKPTVPYSATMRSSASAGERLASAAVPRRTLWGVGPSSPGPVVGGAAAARAESKGSGGDGASASGNRGPRPATAELSSAGPADGKAAIERLEVKAEGKAAAFDITPAKGNRPRPITRTGRPERVELPDKRPTTGPAVPSSIAASVKPPTLPKVAPLTSGAGAARDPAAAPKPPQPSASPPPAAASPPTAGAALPPPTPGAAKVPLPLTTLGDAGPSPFDLEQDENPAEAPAVDPPAAAAPPLAAPAPPAVPAPETAPLGVAPGAASLPPVMHAPGAPEGAPDGAISAETIALTTGDFELTDGAMMSAAPVYEEHSATGDLLGGPFQRILSWVRQVTPWVKSHLPYVIGGGVGLVTILVVIIVLAAGGGEPEGIPQPKGGARAPAKTSVAKKPAKADEPAAKPAPQATAKGTKPDQEPSAPTEKPAGGAPDEARPDEPPPPSEPAVKPEPKPEPVAKPKPVAKPEPKPKPVAKPEPKPKPVAKPKPVPKPKPKPKVAQPKPRPKPVAKPRPKPKPRHMATKRRAPPNRPKPKGKKKRFDLEGTVDPF